MKAPKIDFIRVNYNDGNYDEFSVVCGWSFSQVKDYLSESDLWSIVDYISFYY